MFKKYILVPKRSIILRKNLINVQIYARKYK